jgi:transposase
MNRVISVCVFFNKIYTIFTYTTLKLIILMQDVIRDYPYQQLDETTVKVLKTKKKKKSKGPGYLWVQRGGPPVKPVILYDYDLGRGGDVASALLARYSGCVQTDGYPTYIGVMADLKVTHALCNVHARRRFTDIIKSLSNAPDTPTSHAHVAIDYYKQLYRIEAQLRDTRESTEPSVWHKYRLQQRQQQSRPVFEEQISWADDLLHRTPPKLALGEALGYLVKHRKGLGVFLDNGIVEMDTNLVENRIPPIALGRRNWLFSDTEHGVKAPAKSILDSVTKYSGERD